MLYLLKIMIEIKVERKKAHKEQKKKKGSMNDEKLKKKATTIDIFFGTVPAFSSFFFPIS